METIPAGNHPDPGGQRSAADREVRGRIEALTVAISVRSLPRIVGSLVDTTLTMQQLRVLSAVVVADGSTTSDLASAFGASMPTTSKLVDRLVTSGLVERIPDTVDQRIRRVVPTLLGRKVVGTVLAARPELGEEVLDGLSLDELKALETGLRAIERELHRTESDIARSANSLADPPPPLPLSTRTAQ